MQARLLELEAAAIASFELPLRQQGVSLRQLTRTFNDIGLKTRQEVQMAPVERGGGLLLAQRERE